MVIVVVALMMLFIQSPNVWILDLTLLTLDIGLYKYCFQAENMCNDVKSQCNTIKILVAYLM